MANQFRVYVERGDELAAEPHESLDAALGAALELARSRSVGARSVTVDVDRAYEHAAMWIGLLRLLAFDGKVVEVAEPALL